MISPLADRFFRFDKIRGKDGPRSTLTYTPLDWSITEHHALNSGRPSLFILQVAERLVSEPDALTAVIAKIGVPDDMLAKFIYAPARVSIENLNILTTKKDPDCILFLLAHSQIEGEWVVDSLRTLPWIWRHPKLEGALQASLKHRHTPT